MRQCHRYLSARQDPLDYAQAIERELPIGSGEIESAHRHLVQKRLKLPGVWWTAANAEHMLALSVRPEPMMSGRATGQRITTMPRRFEVTHHFESHPIGRVQLPFQG
jgi:hypothetical protein